MVTWKKSRKIRGSDTFVFVTDSQKNAHEIFDEYLLLRYLPKLTRLNPEIAPVQILFRETLAFITKNCAINTINFTLIWWQTKVIFTSFGYAPVRLNI